MPAWIHQDHSSGRFGADDIVRQVCPFCQITLKGWQAAPEYARTFTCFFLFCPQCGWWTRFVASEGKSVDGDFIDANQTFVESTDRRKRPGDNGRKGDPIVLNLVGTCAVLKALDLRDVSVPIDEIRAYLVAKFGDRHDLHWRTFEEVVAAVFRDLGYDAVIGAGQKDGGVDVVLAPPDGAPMIGVQVKQSRNTIQVSQIREFLGALIDKGLTEGLFVTTSEFTGPAEKQAARYSAMEAARPIRLLDAARFYDALKLATRPPDYGNWIKDTADLPDFLLWEELPVYLHDKLPMGYLFGATLSNKNAFRITWPSLGPRHMPWVTRENTAVGAPVSSHFWGFLDDGFDVQEFT